jgi:anti-sigma factor RsiW
MTLPHEKSQECRAFLRVVESYVDGELAPAAIVEGDRHVAQCEHCRERVNLGRAMKGSVRELARTPMPTDAKARLRAAMQAEVARTPASPKVVPLPRAAVASLAAAGFAAAAAFVLAPRFSPGRQARVEAEGDDVLSELVAEHVRPLPMDGTDVQTVRSLEQYVGVPLRPHFPQSRARLVGARILPVQKERAAIVRYELAAPPPSPIAHVSQSFQAAPPAPARVSVLVFDPRRIHLNPQIAELSEPFGPRPVRVTRAHGLPIAVTERDGVGYAISGDVDERQALELVRYVAGE